ncbi:MAG TPA: hypothetical protein ENH82_04580, partial [bacterium]|nr:hypothetical protein [bacterium]
MAISIGIDIGSVSIKAAVVGTKEDEVLLKNLYSGKLFFPYNSIPEENDYFIVLSEYRRIKGQPLDAVENILSSITEILGDTELCLAMTGSGGKLAGKRYNAPVINEF